MYSQETWRVVTENRGVELVGQYISQVSLYLLIDSSDQLLLQVAVLQCSKACIRKTSKVHFNLQRSDLTFPVATF